MPTQSRWFVIACIAVLLTVAGGTAWLFGAGRRVDGSGGRVAHGENLPEIFGSAGTAPGCFYRPRGITADLQGRIYSVDQLGRVQVLDADGRALRNWLMPETAVGKPEGLAIDLDGNLLVADTHYSRVILFSPEGRELARFGRYGTGPGEFTYPLAVAVDRRSGRIYISEYGQDNDRVQIFTSEGRYVKSFGGFGVEPGQFRRPSGLAIDAAGQVYVADAVNHRIQVFSAEGEWLRMFGGFGPAAGELAFPYDVAVTPGNEVLVCEFGNNRVQAFSAAGVSLGMVGQAGDRPGQLGTPWCLTLEPQAGGGPAKGLRVVVSDTLNHRLCRWRLEQIILGGGRPAGATTETARSDG